MRVTNAPASRERRRRRLKLAKGFYGARSKLFRTATEAVDRAMRLATAHRKLKKRNFRQLWIGRVNAAARQEGISYSKLIAGLTKAGVALNRKMLSEIAIRDPEGFKSIVEIAKNA
ncbi:MAG: 50S ribosomal protein L20 [Kiritimatiellae bacterium]|jgi:large subunit ribosomal protein L20|nr:50S ribosomal protein L20 [Kiritimatiellia bacterium]MBR2354841.1 50S ribosomal protein L20 [Kiritimatiellia bacterium]MBR2488443.1 50S ribosomal protein L20 [Kiritimatiellia bacterium]MBR2938547.1 50S ribosomal protein L20 [Kiritimatiellia bacterium]